MSYYRSSELAGALFFGRLAGVLPAGQLQNDITRHFADESMHAYYWTQSLSDLGFKADRIRDAYQDAYLEAMGVPANVMEILAVTKVFEERVLSQYQAHLAISNLHPVIEKTIRRIVDDEHFHVQWINKTLKAMEADFGAAHIASTLNRLKTADEAVYQKTRQEHKERLAHIYK